MKELIKAIRSRVNMSQGQFASALGTTPISITRWENGKSMPNQMAQNNLYQFCKSQGIDVADLVTEILCYEHNIDDNRRILYHGSKKGIDGKIAPISRAECDFGQGFYMGMIRPMASGTNFREITTFRACRFLKHSRLASGEGCI